MTAPISFREGSHAAPFILQRWSPRAFTPVGISELDLLALLEAGRWAPSAYNHQPWRFIHARRDTPDWERFLSWLIPFNRSWTEQASALVYVASRRVTDDTRNGGVRANQTHAFDTGAASVLVQLQAWQSGWAAHPISGFDHALAHEGLNLPEDHDLHAALVIGRKASAEVLPEGLAEREHPSDRLPLADVVFSGRFPVP